MFYILGLYFIYIIIIPDIRLNFPTNLISCEKTCELKNMVRNVIISFFYYSLSDLQETFRGWKGHGGVVHQRGQRAGPDPHIGPDLRGVAG